MHDKKISVAVYHHYENLIKLLEIFLSARYKVTLATNSVDELKCGLSILPEVILFDVQKLDHKKLKIIHWLKTKNKITPPSVIAIGLIEDKEKILQAGADGFVPAYFDLSWIEQELNRVTKRL